ncbi:MAG: glutamate--tRNA ligase [Verrucomicrobiales bacterium]|nr:glutamate--tRNA ligase [Verrucomicrobiales bacterium]
MSVRTRFAPSPTGFLHIGGARTALYNWLYAKKSGGIFVLRVEDTDAARHNEEGLGKILEGLRWLGLTWDEGPDAGGDFGPYYQSERGEIYDRHLARLRESGHVYDDDGAVRFRVPDRDITVHDVICGEVTVNLHEQGSTRWDADLKENVPANPDLVIRRPDGSYIFHFCNVVDDLEMGISHVIRGEDHLSNTPKHLALFEALGAKPPVYAHIPLNLNQNGSKMSKRDQGALIHEYMENGFLPEAVNNYMALLGWSSKDDQEIFTMAELAERFDLDGVNKANSKFDYEKCLWVNGEHLKRLDPADLLERAKPFFAKVGIDADDARLPKAVELTRERAQRLSDMPTLVMSAFSDQITYDPEAVAKVTAKEGLGAVLNALHGALSGVADWTEDGIKHAIHAAAEGLGQKVGAFMLPCRVATMGGTTGPDLMPMLAMMGRDRVLKRLNAFSSTVAG